LTSSIHKILYACLINVKKKKKNANMPPNHFNVWHLSAPSGCRLLTVCFLPVILEVSVLVRGGTLGEDVGPAPPVGGQLHPHVTRVKGVY
jgi:hypothetical protein